ncbi:MAG: DNA cytosine methyltransferase [Gordonia sp. (in: high G+C Gram-positive bacteria)]|uniref:DNA cytosine methyltransferase n=1 Tax=Gordonia sp. (in: high G+C Gram-positive bacteria) TaxID=84139 RepID=UPI003C78F22E
MTNRQKLTTVSLFSGAGGLDAGLDAVGEFDLLACVEVDPSFCDTLSHNRDRGLFGSDRTEVICADLSKLDPFELMDRLGLAPGQLDVLVGGPPCQSFSTAGRRGTVEDPRGLLLWDFLRFVDALKPRYFLMENVRGLISAALRHRPIAERPERGGPPLAADEVPGSVMDSWISDLLKIDSAAYRADLFEVNSVNYGAPQLRERVLIFGNRRSQVLDFPAPTHGTETQPYASLAEALDGFVEDVPVLMDFSPRKKGFLSQVPPGGNWRMLPDEVARESMGKAYFAKGGRSGWWRRLSWDLPCPTITTLPNHSSTSMCHPDEVRVLSVGECARIQEFPDGWEFVGSPQQQMKQVGNAVPTRLGSIAGRVIADAARGKDGGAESTTPAFRRKYLKSHVRTRQWFKAGKALVWDGAGGSAEYSAKRASQETLF